MARSKKTPQKKIAKTPIAKKSPTGKKHGEIRKSNIHIVCLKLIQLFYADVMATSSDVRSRSRRRSFGWRNADAVLMTVLPKIPSLRGIVSHTGVIAAVDKTRPNLES